MFVYIYIAADGYRYLRKKSEGKIEPLDEIIRTFDLLLQFSKYIYKYLTLYLILYVIFSNVHRTFFKNINATVTKQELILS